MDLVRFYDDRVRQAVGGADQVAVEVAVVHARHEDVLGHGGPGQVGVYRHAGCDRVLLVLRQEDRGAAVAGGQNRLQLLDRAREDVAECFGDVLVAFRSQLVAVLEGVRDTLLDGHILLTVGLDLQEGRFRTAEIGRGFVTVNADTETVILIESATWCENEV